MQSNYNFNVNCQFSPDMDSIKVRDTIYLTVAFPTSLKDQNSGHIIDYSNSDDIESTLRIAQLVEGDSLSEGAAGDFKYYSSLGRIYNSTAIPSPELVQQLKYQQIGSDYQLKVGLIPQQTGIFALAIGDGVSNTRNNSNKCKKQVLNLLFPEHLNMFIISKTGGPDIIYLLLKFQNLYCFKVY